MNRGSKHNSNRYGKRAQRIRRKQVQAIRRFSVGAAAVLLIICCSFGFGSFFSSAHGNSSEDPVDYKYYKSIQIEEGDSLWSIAEDYMGDNYDSVVDYIDELAAVNRIDRTELDHLHTGDYLTVVYYTAEFEE